MDVKVQHNPDEKRYEAVVDGKVVGIADYDERGDALVFPHTVIDASMRGKGLGAVLVRGALDDVRPSGRTVVPACWYVAQFIEENPDYADMLAS